MIMNDYSAIIQAKTLAEQPAGFGGVAGNPALFDWQAATVEWACRQGRCALFADTGLGKTAMQLQWAREVCDHTGGRVLLLAPLAVGAQTMREAAKFGIEGVEHCRDSSTSAPIVVTNYERLHHFDESDFTGVVLDESSILKNYTGKTKRQLVATFSNTPYRLACTATPAPNDHIELGNHSEYLSVMDSHRMLARWFISDQSQAGAYRLKGHAVKPYWDWVTSWARCIGRPSDMGPYSDDGYDLPELRIHRDTVGVDLIDGREDALFRLPQLSATAIHREKRRTSADRAGRIAELVAEHPHEPWTIWVETDYDADAVKAVLPNVTEVRGSMPPEEKARRLLDFTDNGGVMLTKPGIAGMGLNWQHCSKVAFSGLSFSYERFYQAVRRSWRFGQVRPVDVHVVMGATETSTWAVIDRKAADHEQMKVEMFAASRRAVGRELNRDPYYPNHNAPVPSWFRSIDRR